MISQENTAIIIPVRLQASRLPNKPLLDIAGKPMIQHVWVSAIASDLGRVVVATDSDEIAKCIESLGGDVCMTSENHQSGTDRIYEALNIFDQNHSDEYEPPHFAKYSGLITLAFSVINPASATAE